MKNYYWVSSIPHVHEYFRAKSCFTDLIPITINENIKLLFEKIEEPFEYIQFKDYGSMTKNPIYKIKFKTFSESKSILKTYKILNGNNLICSLLLNDLYLIKIVNKLLKSKNGNVNYINDVNVTKNYVKVPLFNLSLSQVYSLVGNILTYRMLLHFYDCPGGRFIGNLNLRVNENINQFISSGGTQYIKKMKKITNEKIDVVFIGDHHLNSNSNFLNVAMRKDLIVKLTEFSNFNIYYKQHPGFVDHNNELLQNFLKMDDEIPIEFFHHNIRIAIGDFSQALVGLSSLGIECYSILPLITLKVASAEKETSFWISYLKERSNNRIKFISEKNQFVKLLENL